MLITDLFRTRKLIRRMLVLAVRAIMNAMLRRSIRGLRLSVCLFRRTRTVVASRLRLVDH